MAERSPAQLRRCGGHPAVDFLNTVDWRGRAEPEEYLCTYGDLLVWCEIAGLLSQRHARRLKRIVKHDACEAILRDAIALREAAYRILCAAIGLKGPKEADVHTVDAMVREARNRLVFQHGGTGFAWHLADESDPRWPLWRVALSLADLLASNDIRNVRGCGGPECGWLFLDTSKNHTRRWCSMDGCGNRAKARRHYARVGSSSRPGSS